MIDAEDTIRAVLSDYLLTRDVRPSTADYYRRVVSVFLSWSGDITIAEFTPELTSRFLLHLQECGKSWSYRKSLRSGLRALLGHAGVSVPRGKLRTVKAEPLDPVAWSVEEIERLLSAVMVLPVARQEYFRRIILVAYYSGLSQCDIHRLESRHVDESGVIRCRRSKTGVAVVTAIPVDLAAELIAGQIPGKPLLPLRTSGEYFRRQFRLIVAAAGLDGSFKRLRKSSGTSVEALHPGRGHEHLGNSRKIFEQHYLDARVCQREPLRPCGLPPRS